MGSAFGALGPLGGAMELGLLEESSPRDLVMTEFRAQSLKRACSPSKTPLFGSPSLSASKCFSPPVGVAVEQVNPSLPCMFGAKEEGSTKHEALLLKAKVPLSRFFLLL